MRGPKSAAIAHKKPETEMMNKRKASGGGGAKEKASNKKSSDAPKRPAGAFFIFMEEFRKSFKENFPDVKSVSAVGKAGGEKWKSMSTGEKFPYVEKATKRKVEYGKALEAYKTKLNGKGGEEEKAEESEKSSSEVNEGSGENDSS